jgi:hypothetical protein
MTRHMLQQKIRRQLNPEYRSKYLKDIAKYGRRNEHQYKEKLLAALGSKCEICKINIPEVLVIHHVDPTKKTRGNSCHKWKRLWGEYQSGVPLRLLCHNHHVLLHCKKLEGDIHAMLFTRN